MVVLLAMVSWTCVLTRCSGRPNTMATAMSAGASRSTTSRSDGLRVNRMITDPTSPMTDESRLVTVCVSRVRTRVTSLERRDTSSPTRCWPWKSSDSVTSRPYSSPRSWATTRSPTTPSSQVWMKLPTAWMQNSPIRSAMSRSRSAESPPPTTSPVIPAMISGNRRPMTELISRPTIATEKIGSCGRR